jgi:hypothetical protein
MFVMSPARLSCLGDRDDAAPAEPLVHRASCRVERRLRITYASVRRSFGVTDEFDVPAQASE